MTDPTDSPDLPPLTEPAGLPVPPRKKGHPVLAWVVIAAVVAFLFLRRHQTPQVVVEANASRANDIVLRLQGRYVVGAATLVPPAERKRLYDQLAVLNTGPLSQRLSFVVLAWELIGPNAAGPADVFGETLAAPGVAAAAPLGAPVQSLVAAGVAGSEAFGPPSSAQRQLRELRTGVDQGTVKGDPEDVALLGVLERLYRDYQDGHLDAPSVTAEERGQLRERLGWFGELALAPEGSPQETREAVLRPARRTAVGMIAVLGGLSSVGLFGLAALIPLVILLLTGRLRGGVGGPFLYGGVYAEAFAVWMALFVGLSFAAAWVKVPGDDLLVHAGVDFLSLVLALAWPVLRGVPWGQLRRDVGLTLGRSPALEPVLGVACYAMTLPLLVVGALLTLALIHLQNYLAGGPAGEAGAVPPNMPVHPIVQVVGDPNWRVLLQLLLLASVAAPIVEETMFRGLLYRQMRESSGGWGRAASILASAAAVSFLFAAIHPQGWTAIPALMSLAVGFSLMREWRGTLIPCMIAHGINNGLVILGLHFALGS
jgi:membrane protease YdiL (CAAX protease family)